MAVRSTTEYLNKLDNLDAEMCKRKDQELGSRATYLKVRLEGEERNQSEIGDMAMKLLELSQTLKNKWVIADVAENRAILEIVYSDFTFKDATLAWKGIKSITIFFIFSRLHFSKLQNTCKNICT